MFLKHSYHLRIADGMFGVFGLPLAFFLLLVVHINWYGEVRWLFERGADVGEDMVVQRRVLGVDVLQELEQRPVVVLAVPLT